MTPVRGLETAVAVTLQCGLLVGCVALIQRRLRSDRARDALWSGCCLGALLLVALPFLVPHLRLVPFPLGWFPPDGLWESMETYAARAGLFVWAAGALVALGRLLVGIARATRVVSRARPLSSEERTRLDDALRRTTPARDPAIAWRVSAETTSPFCWQIHEPVVVLTEAVLALPADELAAVLRHELAHLRERHPLQLFLQRLASVVLWFHPAMRWSLRQALRCREFVCDRAAAGSREETAAYLRGLLRLSEARLKTGGELRLALLDRGTTLEERIVRLKSPAAPAGRACLAAARVVPVALACALAVTVWAPLDPTASSRSRWSPWPRFSSRALQAVGVPVRDYEVDGHRLLPHERRQHRRPGPNAH